ncbi:MAG: MFS transporter [Terrimicrobiaceae bacterium]
MNFYPFTSIETISPRPMLFITGEISHFREFSEEAYKLAGQPKELVVVPGAGLVDLYDRVELIPFDNLTSFFTEDLKQPIDFAFNKRSPGARAPLASTTRNDQMKKKELSSRQTWSAVGSMALCVSTLIAAEFMPVSLLTPIARDLRATEGMAGQAISISGLFALVASLLIATVAGRYNRRHVLLGLTGVMLASLILIAVAPNFLVLMIARALLGVVVGGFWSLSTATVMRLVPEETVPKALGIIFTGLTVASAFAAPIGSYVGGIIGWRGVFWALTPLVVVTLIWQWLSLPSMEPQTTNPIGKLFGLLKRRHVAFAMAGVMLTYAGAFAGFTYLRPFLESYTHVSLPQLSLLLLG